MNISEIDLNIKGRLVPRVSQVFSHKDVSWKEMGEMQFLLFLGPFEKCLEMGES